MINKICGLDKKKEPEIIINLTRTKGNFSVPSKIPNKIPETSYNHFRSHEYCPNEILIETKVIETKVFNPINKGTGAGGVNTNKNGKSFEKKTDNQQRLLEIGYVKKYFIGNTKKTYNYYLSKLYDDKNVVFVLQNGLKTYMKNNYSIDMFRCPDEAYIIEYNDGSRVIKILEKKAQNSDGSVETKLWAGPSLKREYELVLGSGFEVEYGFCLSNFLKEKMVSKEKKYMILNTILNENNIKVLFGDDENYFETFDTWFNNSL